MRRLIRRYNTWNSWRKYNTGGRFFKFMVLIGLAHSPSFEAWIF